MRKLFICLTPVICCFLVCGCLRKKVIGGNDGSKEVTVSKEEFISKEEINTTVDDPTDVSFGGNDNPTEIGCSLQLPSLPFTVNNTDSNGAPLTTVIMEEVEYKFEKNDNGTYWLRLDFKGVKTYEKKNLNQVYNVYAYILYDEEGREVAREAIYCGGIKVGERFVNEYNGVNDLPAGNYRLELSDY